MQAIYFDLDGTLLQYDREYEGILAEAFRAVEGAAPADRLAAYDDAFVERFLACEPAPYREAFATVSDHPDALVDALRERETAAATVADGARATLRRLTDEYRVGVLTNGVTDWQRHKLAAHDLARHVDAVVTSYDAGARKPAPAIFALAEERLPAEAYALIGDADSDVEGARDAGWTPVRYDGQGLEAAVAAIDWV